MHDGSLENVLVDGSAPDLIEDNAGALDVCKRFSRPLEKGEEVTVSLSYELKNAFLKPRESVIHFNSSDVGELTITVELPRPCITAELRRTYSGDHGKVLDPPRLSANHQIIEATIRKPRMGASYHVDWTW